MTPHRLQFALLTFLYLFSSALFANSNYFKEGIKAFKAGNYSAACIQFEHAYNSGLRKGSLLYNLGTCNYKQGKYKKSKQWFIQLTKIKKPSQIAYYNLGLISDKEDNSTDAKHWYRLAQQGANQTIAALALHQLDKHTKIASNSKGFSLLNFAFGYDDNIIDPTATTATNAGDNYLSVFIMASQHLSPNVKDGWSISGSAYLTDYFSVNAYDMLNIKGGVTRSINAKEWPSKISLSYGQSSLNGANYLSKTSLMIKSKNRHLNSGIFEARYQFNRIHAANPASDHLSGNQQRLTIENRWYGTQQKQLRLGYEFEQNNRNDIYTATILTTSYSPTRHKINLRGYSRLTKDWLGKIQLSYRISRYPIDSSLLQRTDLSTTAKLSIERKIWKRWSFSPEIKHTNNHSNITSASYSRNDFSIQLTRSF